MSFVAELRRRNVFRVALFYVVTAWLVIEVAETVLPLFEVPDGTTNGYRETVLVLLGAYDLLPFAMLVWGPDYAHYRRSPEFKDYMRRSGVLDYWREHGFPSQCRPVGEEDFTCE